VANSVEVSSAATALKDERLTFVWLDGEVQEVSFQLRRCVSYQMKCSSYVKVVVKSHVCHGLGSGNTSDPGFSKWLMPLSAIK